MNAAALRSWLLQQPRPAQLRLTAGRDIRLVPIVQGATWSHVAKTVEAMTPDLVEALDSGGNLLRALRPDDDNGEEASSAATMPAPALPSNAALIVDPETARFQLFAQLLSEAYRHANDVAFTKLVDIANIMGKRGESLEKSLSSTERLLRQAWQEKAEIEVEAAAAQAEDPLGQLAGALMGGMQQGATDAAKSKPNGKG